MAAGEGECKPRVVVAGGGAAGFFGAIACAEASAVPLEILIVERGREVLSKVRISGGGRCNVTHDLDDPQALSDHYPRGSRSLIGAFYRWGQEDTVAWFASHGVALKAESDGRMFPITDSSETVIECLRSAANGLGIAVRTGCGVCGLAVRSGGGIGVHLDSGETVEASAVLVATGGLRSGGARKPVASAGHPIERPVPSLFTFKIDEPGLTELAGLSVARAQVWVDGTRLASCGPVLVTHWGLSGPAILRLSALGARDLEGLEYRFALRVDWTGGEESEASLRREFERWRVEHGGRKVGRRCPLDPLPRRMWGRLVHLAGIPDDRVWSELARVETAKLCELILGERLEVTGKSLNKDEFVTCGGVRLKDVDMKTMRSRLVPGLYFAGEVLDIDGLTGGFNFQSAWTTGRIAGESMAAALGQPDAAED